MIVDSQLHGIILAVPAFQILEYQLVLVMYSPGSLHVCSGEKDNWGEPERAPH